ncbi:MAG: HDIG domain-containing metalloprotein, partial [Verrucomicrobiota bacterium]
MKDWFKKQILVRRGLSSGKSRRSSRAEEWRDFFDSSIKLRILVLLLTFLSFTRIGTWQSEESSLASNIVYSVLIFAMCLVLISLWFKQIWNNNRMLILVMSTVLINLLINKWLYYYDFSPELMTIVEQSKAAFFLPSAMGPMICTILISMEAGLLVAFLISLVSTVYVEPSMGFLMGSMLTSFSACYFCRSIRRRFDLIAAGMGIAMVGAGIVLVLFLGGAMVDVNFNSLLVQVVLAVVAGIAISSIVSVILPILEWMFDRITDISWVELTDLNHPLLKRMTIESPGTYHHSLMVANLAEAAAESIGANATMCRVCAYFHDIGKINKPEYFVENSTSERNAHDNLSPTMSALIIIAHVKDGVDLALKYGLRQPVIDVIQQHHGTSLVYYFYKKAKQQQEDLKEGSKILKGREEDLSDIDERSFRYPGPIPQFKESALVSLADALESSSRTLKNPTAQKIENLVHDIINDRVM